MKVSALFALTMSAVFSASAHAVVLGPENIFSDLPVGSSINGTYDLEEISGIEGLSVQILKAGKLLTSDAWGLKGDAATGGTSASVWKFNQEVDVEVMFQGVLDTWQGVNEKNIVSSDGTITTEDGSGLAFIHSNGHGIVSGSGYMGPHFAFTVEGCTYLYIHHHHTPSDTPIGIDLKVPVSEPILLGRDNLFAGKSEGELIEGTYDISEITGVEGLSVTIFGQAQVLNGSTWGIPGGDAPAESNPKNTFWIFNQDVDLQVLVQGAFFSHEGTNIPEKNTVASEATVEVVSRAEFTDLEEAHQGRHQTVSASGSSLTGALGAPSVFSINGCTMLLIVATDTPAETGAGVYFVPAQ